MLNWRKKKKGLPYIHSPILSTGATVQILFKSLPSKEDELDF